MKSIIHHESKQERCYICGQWATDTHHCIHGNGRRKLADKDGLTVRLCHRCHMNLHDKGASDEEQNPDKELKRIAQARWMEYYGKSEDDFRERYGKSYL